MGFSSQPGQHWHHDSYLLHAQIHFSKFMITEFKFIKTVWLRCTYRGQVTNCMVQLTSIHACSGGLEVQLNVFNMSMSTLNAFELEIASLNDEQTQPGLNRIQQLASAADMKWENYMVIWTAISINMQEALMSRPSSSRYKDCVTMQQIYCYGLGYCIEPLERYCCTTMLQAAGYLHRLIAVVRLSLRQSSPPNSADYRSRIRRRR